MDGLCFPAVLPNASTGNRSKRVLLPKVFFVYTKHDRCLHGAFLVTACEHQDGTDVCQWLVGRWVELVNHVHVEPAMIRWTQATVHFQPQHELEFRRMPVIGGSTVHVCFPECAGERWRAWPLNDSQIDFLRRSGELCVLTSGRRFADATHIAPAVVECPGGIRDIVCPTPMHKHTDRSW